MGTNKCVPCPDRMVQMMDLWSWLLKEDQDTMREWVGEDFKLPETNSYAYMYVHVTREHGAQTTFRRATLMKAVEQNEAALVRKAARLRELERLEREGGVVNDATVDEAATATHQATAAGALGGASSLEAQSSEAPVVEDQDESAVVDPNECTAMVLVPKYTNPWQQRAEKIVRCPRCAYSHKAHVSVSAARVVAEIDWPSAQQTPERSCCRGEKGGRRSAPCEDQSGRTCPGCPLQADVVHPPVATLHQDGPSRWITRLARAENVQVQGAATRVQEPRRKGTVDSPHGGSAREAH